MQDPFAYPKPYWLPDWQDPNAYVDHGRDLAAWGWEFLRRNPLYQADFDLWRQKVETDPGGAREIQDAVCCSWGVSSLEDPAQDYAPELFEMAVDVPPFWLGIDTPSTVFNRETGEWELEEGERKIPCPWESDDDEFMQVCAFDLRYPIADQIRQVETALAALRHHFEIKTVSRPKLHTGDFAQLLRVFDASWNGAADDDQVREIYSSDQRKATTPTEIHDEQLRWSTAGLESIRRKRKDAVRYVLEDFAVLFRWSRLPKVNRAPSKAGG